jgi:hypothetical protein
VENGISRGFGQNASEIVADPPPAKFFSRFSRKGY